MCGGDGVAERVGQRFVDRVSEVVKGAVLVEASHLHRPFDGGAGAADRELPVGSRVMATTPR